MKRKIALLLASILCVCMVAACSNDSNPSPSPSAGGESPAVSPTGEASPGQTADATDGASNQPEGEAKYSIKVGATSVPHAVMLELIKDDLLAKGVEMEILTFTDYVQPNISLDSGDLDANFFQHIHYMENQNKENNTELVSIAGVHYEPMAIYAGKSSDLASIADGAEIAVPNDGTNEARALNILEKQGLIKIDESAGLNATVRDISENPQNLKITEMDAAQLPKVLQDVDFAVINGNYAMSNGLTMDDALAVEAVEDAETFINVLAVNKGDEEREELKILADMLTSEKIRTFLLDEYKGAVVPVFGEGDE